MNATMSNKTGVCLVLDNNNYGSMLQSYATQQFLHDQGVSFDLIRYKKKLTLLFLLRSCLRLFSPSFISTTILLAKKKRYILGNPNAQVSLRKRKNAFDNFRKIYFKAPIVTYYGYPQLVEKCRQYGSFITGSDQLWTPSGLSTKFYNLMFVAAEKTKISYASSFGVRNIPWYQRRRTREYLLRIEHISCRERSGQDIVKYLTCREVPVVVDPTMLFSYNQWNQLFPDERLVKNEYIFSYQLSFGKNSREEVKRLKEATGMTIVTLPQYTWADHGFGDVVIEGAGPVEFVNLIKHAAYVCTDSFHGSVFSILYHKKFVVFNRYSDERKFSRNTRIDTLCDSLNLQSRRFSGDIVSDMMPDIDYDQVEQKIEILRNDSLAYLKTAFNSIGMSANA